MTGEAKRKTLAWLMGVVILTIVIAAALPTLELKPGVPLPLPESAPYGAPSAEALPWLAISISAFWKAVLGLFLVASLVYTVYRALKETVWIWRDVLRAILYLIPITLILVGLVLALSRVRVTLQPVELEIPPEMPEIPGPPLGAVPRGLIWLVWLGLAAALVAFGLWLAFRRPAHRDRLKLEAERALQALKAGLDLKNVILQSYWQMTLVLQEEQGYEREAAMTTREFEHLLQARGVPAAPVHQLTQLFEAVRYGRRAPTSDDERQAADCLTAIVRYSHAGTQPH